MRKPLRILLAAAILFVFGVSMFTMTVRQGETAVVIRMGAPHRVATEPGLYFKLPGPFDSVTKVDARVRRFATRHVEMLTRDRRNVIVMVYAFWGVHDPLLYMQTFDNATAGPEQALDGLLSGAAVAVIGKYDFSNLFNTDEQSLKIDEIEADILAALDAAARDRYGIEVRQVGFKRLVLPQQNVASVFNQMRAERSRIATRHSAGGELRASDLMSLTDLERAGIVAQAKQQEARIKGEAEAEAARIYAHAYSRNPGFYRFIRSLDALSAIFSTSTTLILAVDGPPFDMISRPPLESGSDREPRVIELPTPPDIESIRDPALELELPMRSQLPEIIESDELGFEEYELDYEE